MVRLMCEVTNVFNVGIDVLMLSDVLRPGHMASGQWVGETMPNTGEHPGSR